MRNRGKKISAIILGSILLLPAFFSLMLIARIQLTRLNMERELEKKCTIQLSISTSDVIWIRPEKEILIEGKLFDIRAVRREGNRLFLTGIFDEEEKELMDIACRNETEKQADGSLIAFLFLLPFRNSTEQGYLNIPDLSIRLWHATNERHLPFQFRHVATPPPDLTV